MKTVQELYTAFLCLLLCATFSASAQTPLQFNDHLSNITDSLYAKGSKWGEQFNIAYQNKQFASIRPQREQLQRFLDARILELQQMKDVKNSKELRMTMLNFLFFEKEMMTNAFLPLEKLSAASTEEEIQQAIKSLTTFAEKESAELKKVRAAQERYGKANGFEIEYAED